MNVTRINTDLNFCVLMAVYHADNSELFIRAVESVFDNSVKPSEFILVQDGQIGIDLLLAIKHVTNKFPIKLITLDVNKGLAKALNEGLQYINSPITFRADSDDYNHQNRFEEQLKAFSQNTLSLCGSHIEEIDSSGKVTGLRKVPLSQDEIKKTLATKNPFNHMTIAFKTRDIIELGGYPDLYLKEDYGLWAKVVASGKPVKNLDLLLVTATAGFDMINRRGGWKYVMSEVQLFKFLRALHLTSFFKGLLVCTARSLIFLSPAFFRSFFYMAFLRSTDPASDKVVGININS